MPKKSSTPKTEEQKEATRKYHREYQRKRLQNPEARTKHRACFRAYYDKNKPEFQAKAAQKRAVDGDTLRARERELYQLNIADKRAKDREKYKKNRETIRKRRREIYKLNLEKFREYRRQYYRANAEEFKARMAKYQERNPHILAANNRKRRVNKLKNSTPEQVKSAEKKIIGFNKLSAYWCAYCSIKLPRKSLVIEHIKPLSKSGAHSAENIILACSPCNLAKRNKILFVEYFPTKPTKELIKTVTGRGFLL